ncbi:MAG: hypothetical protein IPJ40_13410 [Saprospirales bacterium]|nr:hypothetical protein [Saprospirales bacterium]
MSLSGAVTDTVAFTKVPGDRPSWPFTATRRRGAPRLRLRPPGLIDQEFSPNASPFRSGGIHPAAQAAGVDAQLITFPGAATGIRRRAGSGFHRDPGIPLRADVEHGGGGGCARWRGNGCLCFEPSSGQATLQASPGLSGKSGSYSTSTAAWWRR